MQEFQKKKKENIFWRIAVSKCKTKQDGTFWYDTRQSFLRTPK